MSRKVCTCGHTQENHSGTSCRFHLPGKADKAQPVKYCKCKEFDDLPHDPPLKAREWKPSPPPAEVKCPVCLRVVGRNAETAKVRNEKREIVGVRHRKCAA